MYAAFISPTGGDAGASDGGVGFHLDKEVLLETAPVFGQPHAIWSNDSGGVFVFSWGYVSGGEFVKIRKFLPNGEAAGGDSDVVPTDSPSGYVGNTSHESGAVGVGSPVRRVLHEHGLDQRPRVDAAGFPRK